MIDEVIRLLAGQHLVVVHGASGCGKSSLVRAGVLPWLALDHAASGVPWRTAIARPAGGPLRNIAAELATALGPPPGATGDPGAAWHDRLALGSVALPDIQAALETAGASLCLLIDQFEELFRWARDNREEAQLVTELLRLIADGAVPRLFVILTMRSDYLGACAGLRALPRRSTAASTCCRAWTISRSCARSTSRPRSMAARWRPRSATGCCSRPGASRIRCPFCSTL